MEKKYTKEQIWELLQRSEAAVRRALVVIYERQTTDEQVIQATKHLNGRGFNGLDARFGSSLAERVKRGQPLTDKQTAAARKMLKKYAGQLALVANEKVA